MFLLLGVALCVSYAFFMYKVTSVGLKVFVTVFFISTFYYGVLGPWYWLEYRSGRFLGAYWLEEMHVIPLVYVLVYLLVSCVVLFRDGCISRLLVGTRRVANPLLSKKVLSIFLALGFVSSLYVYVVGGGQEGAVTTDPFLLILYQISDVLIACILFAFSCSDGKRFKWWLVVLVFVLYAVFTGLRYKIALLLGPILLAYYYDGNTALREKVILAASIAFLIVGFAVMTVSRSKFSGIDLDALYDVDAEMFFYGLFAETNGVFALSAAISQYGRELSFVYFEPIWEVVVQFVPRFLYPEKDLYGHLRDIAFGIAMTEESMRSGTAVPFFGEYYVMFGWLGVFVGVVAYCFFTIWLIGRVIIWSVSPRQALIGVALISVYMGYYYYSRGSVAQISKGLVFVILPYLILLRLQGIKSIRIV